MSISGAFLSRMSRYFFRLQSIHVLDRLSSQETEVHHVEVLQNSVSQSELSERIQVEEELDESSSLSMRPAAQVQVSLLRLPVQGQDRRTEAHSDEASELRCLCHRYFSAVEGWVNFLRFHEIRTI